MSWQKVFLILGIGFLIVSFLTILIPTVAAVIIAHDGTSIIEKMNTNYPDHTPDTSS